MDKISKPRSVIGYIKEKHEREAASGEVLDCEREPTNQRDRYAVAKGMGIVMGHVPRKMAKL